MKASELRIGNYYNQNGAIGQVTPNTIEEAWTSERSWIKPIPLTEEWLLRFGFKLVSSYNKEKMVFLLQFGLSKDNFTFESNYGELIYFRYNGNYISVKNVHNLQNLYFALTGEELIINN
jgi:hypothetical protein